MNKLKAEIILLAVGVASAPLPFALLALLGVLLLWGV